MKFAKQNKNSLLSLLFLVLAVVWFFLVIYLEHISLAIFNFIDGNFPYGYITLYGPMAILSIFGTIFALKYRRLKESDWKSNLLTLVGVIFSLIGLFPLFLLIYLAFFFGR